MANGEVYEKISLKSWIENIRTVKHLSEVLHIYAHKLTNERRDQLWNEVGGKPFDSVPYTLHPDKQKNPDIADDKDSVSYTHLTLPTILLV